VSGFEGYGENDTPHLYDGDNKFVGVNSYVELESVPPTFLEKGFNIRINDKENANVILRRKGLDFLAGLSGISPSYTYSRGDEQCFAFGVYSDPDDDKKDWLVAATKQAAIIWDGTTPYYVNYYSADIASGSVDAGTDVWGAPAHKFQVGDAVQLTTTGTLPTGVTTATTYYVIDFSASSIQLASSYENALAGTQINITTAGSGTHTVQSIVDTSHEPEVVQAFNQVYIMRYKNRHLCWDGATAATGSVVNTEFESLSSTSTLSGGGAGTGDPFPSTNTTAYIANRLIGVQPREIATPTQGVTDSSTVVLTDLLENNNITPVDSEWYINQGAADYVVGFAPYQENNMLIFNRRSITVASNVHATPISVRYQLTERYGCIAKRTIVNAGNFFFFLSDEGVMQLNPALDAVTQAGAAVSKLQGAVTPISRDIQDLLLDYIDNQDVDVTTCAAVHDNKYYISFQDGVFDGLVKRSRVFVYDLTFGVWMSQDTYPIDIIDLKVMPYTTGSGVAPPRLFACCKEGWYLLEENALDDEERIIGSVSETDTVAINSEGWTRSYTFDSGEVKQLQQIDIGAKVSNGGTIQITLDTFEPDSSQVVDTYTNSSGAQQQVIRKIRIRNRGYSFRVRMEVNAGDAEFRHIKLKAIPNVYGMRNVS
jgi:hypothetical protein